MNNIILMGIDRFYPSIIICALALLQPVISRCSSFSMGTKPYMQDVVRAGIVSDLWSVHSNSTFYAMYDQSTDYLYLDYPDALIDVFISNHSNRM